MSGLDSEQELSFSVAIDGAKFRFNKYSGKFPSGVTYAVGTLMQGSV